MHKAGLPAAERPALCCFVCKIQQGKTSALVDLLAAQMLDGDLEDLRSASAARDLLVHLLLAGVIFERKLPKQRRRSRAGLHGAAAPKRDGALHKRRPVVFTAGLP